MAVAAVLAAGGSPARAEEGDRVKEVEKRIEALAREVSRLLAGEEGEGEGRTAAPPGLAPAAAGVYRVDQGASIGGYGEMLYENFSAKREDGAASGKKDQADLLRGIVYVGYKFDDRFLFNSEIEIEHASSGKAGEVSLEFAYVEGRITENAGLRAGLLLVPLGFVNELHEPPVLLGARRPEIEQRIIPSTWRENGIGAFGSAGRFSWRACVVNGMDGAGSGPSTAAGYDAAGLRGGRQSGSKALAEDLAVAARVDVEPAGGLLAGAAIYRGGAGQSNVTPSGAAIEATTTIAEAHFDWRRGPARIRGLLVEAWVDDAALLNEFKGLAGNAGVGERMRGFYLEGGWDLFAGRGGEAELVPYARYERLNTQEEVPAGYSVNPARETSVVTAGLAWRPVVQVVARVEGQWHRNEADTGVNQGAFQVGYLF